MYIMSAFIGKYTFHVHQVAHDWILTGNTHAAQHLAGFPGYMRGDLTSVSFAIDTCAGDAFFSFIRTPSRQFINWALVISVIISASFFC